MTAPAGPHPAGDTVSGALGTRYPYVTPGQCGLLETTIIRGLVAAADRGCAAAVIRPQTDGALDISILIIGSAAQSGRASCPASCGSPPPGLRKRIP